jgi:predicted enzyme related to lactoylglutathione lyase
MELALLATTQEIFLLAARHTCRHPDRSEVWLSLARDRKTLPDYTGPICFPSWCRVGHIRPMAEAEIRHPRHVSGQLLTGYPGAGGLALSWPRAGLLAQCSGQPTINYAGAHQHAMIGKESFMTARQSLTSIGQLVPELPVTDVERAQQHYRDALGFEIGWLHPDGIGAVSRGNVAIFFRKTTPPFDAAVHWVFADDIDATYNELKSTGANIVEPLEKKPWGLRQFTVEDIDGNRFYFHHD